MQRPSSSVTTWYSQILLVISRTSQGKAKQIILSKIGYPEKGSRRSYGHRRHSHTSTHSSFYYRSQRNTAKIRWNFGSRKPNVVDSSITIVKATAHWFHATGSSRYLSWKRPKRKSEVVIQHSFTRVWSLIRSQVWLRSSVFTVV